MKKNLIKAEILRKKSDIMHVFQFGNVYKTSGLRLHIIRNNFSICRAVFITPKKYFHLATQRVQERRYLREIFRLLKEALNNYYDMVWIISNKAEFSIRFNQVKTLLQKAGAVKK